MNATELKVTATSKDEVVEFIEKILDTFDFNMPLVVRAEPKDRAKDYKALVGIWSREAAAQFSERDRTGKLYTDKEIRRLWYHKFLGYTKPETIGRTQIQPRLRSITDLETRGENYDYARKIEEWCSNVGVTLSQPESEYKQDKERQNQ